MNYSSLCKGVYVNFSSESGERIAEERKRLGLSQANAAELCGVSREMWGKYERGKAAMGTEVLSRFVLAGSDARYVLTGQPAIPGSNPDLPPDEELLLEAYRGLDPAMRKALLAEMLTGKKAKDSGGAISVKGSGHRVAGRNYNEGKK